MGKNLRQEEGLPFCVFRQNDFLKIPVGRVGGKHLLCEDAKRGTAWAGMEPPLAIGADVRILRYSLAQEDTCPFQTIKTSNEITALNK